VYPTVVKRREWRRKMEELYISTVNPLFDYAD
jgi:hypothetical protein